MVKPKLKKKIKGEPSYRKIGRYLALDRHVITSALDSQITLAGQGYPVHPAPDTFGEAMALYHQCRFREAGVIFAQGAEHDPPSRHYQKRCQYFLENPPPPDWGGLWIASEK